MARGTGEGVAAADRGQHGVDRTGDPRGGLEVRLVSAALSAGSDAGQPGRAARPLDLGGLGEAGSMVAEEPL